MTELVRHFPTCLEQSCRKSHMGNRVLQGLYQNKTSCCALGLWDHYWLGRRLLQGPAPIHTGSTFLFPCDRSLQAFVLLVQARL